MKNIKLMVIAFLVLSFAVFAEGSLSLSSDPCAMPGFKGTTSFNPLPMSGRTLKADVEYAVFAPGNYTGNDPTLGNEYIYAYQIFNRSESNVTVDFFSVGIMPGSSISYVYTDTAYANAMPGGVNTLYAFNFLQSAGYMFVPPNSLNPNLHSSVLLFTSIYSPTMVDFGSMSGGGLVTSGALPTPSLVPEPATLIILLLGGAILPLRRK